MTSCSAIDVGIFTITERNLSIEVPPNLTVESSGEVAMAFQDIKINSTDHTSGNATLAIMSIYNRSTENLKPENLAEVMGEVMIGALKLAGGNETGTVLINNGGQNITIHEVMVPTSTSKSAAKTYRTTRMAFWNIDRMTMMLTSTLDENTTIGIIKSLAIKP